MSDFPYIHRILPPAHEMFTRLRETSFPSDASKLIRMWPNDYISTDSLSCHYTEHQRMQCNKYGKPSPLEYYTQNESRFIPGDTELYTFADSILHMNDLLYPYVCNHFNPTYTVWILRAVSAAKGNVSLKVLDPCAGWGDRLLGSLASGVLSEYQGYDSNVTLQDAYKLIIDTYATPDVLPASVVTCGNFEDSDVKVDYYDIVLTSPPYGPDLEQYNGAPVIPSGSLMFRYHNWFLTVYTKFIQKAFAALKQGGSLVLYVEDYRVTGRHFPFRQDTIRLLDTLSLTRQDNFNLEVSYGSSPGIIRSALHYTKH